MGTALASSANAREEVERVARKLIWWKPPSEALEDRPRFLAQVMTLGNWNEVQLVQKVFGREAFRQVLLNPPAGVFDPRSWNYWHVVFGISPVPPLPKRKL